ncbi:MAG: hypothetical protein JXB38_19130 [Anaerolineales bacterium]|nr:hypothetical protein [Anaerolineales bacterium]
MKNLLYKRAQRLSFSIIVFVVFSACNLPQDLPPTPTPTLALLPTNTPVVFPSATPVILQPTNTPSPTQAPTSTLRPYDAAAFIADVTVPDGSKVAPGETFLKTWRIKNIGTTTWDTSYATVFHSGERMSSSARVALGGPVYPGQVVDVSMYLTAPEKAGEYRGNWILQNTSGYSFGFGSDADVPLYVIVKVSAKDDYPEIASEGEDFELEDGECFDFDRGKAAVDLNDRCDFKLVIEDDYAYGEIKLVPVNAAEIAFEDDFSKAPTLEKCKDSDAYLDDERVITPENDYLCFNTDPGRYGYIYFYDIDESSIIFDWVTWEK